MTVKLSHGRFVADVSDPPFAVPADIVLDLPAPPSVNKTRRYDWRHKSVHEGWHDLADRHVIATKKLPLTQIEGAYEVHITMSPTLRMDLDNGIKALIDYLCRIKLVRDDSRKFFRKL